MDTIAKIMILVFALFVSHDASANYPAKIRQNTYCFTPQSSYSCNGPMFGSAEPAADYACQQIMATTNYKSSEVATANFSGLTAWNTYSWQFKCVNKTTGTFNTQTGRVQALADCGINSPVASFAPATCTGDAPPAVPLECTTTNGLTITAFHSIPVQLKGCYAGCRYSASVVAVSTYNGVDYSTGSWVGDGQTCDMTETTLIGGIPGNAQNVGGGGGLTAQDLLGIARESTLQQLLANAQSTAATNNQNKTILEAIKNSTEQMANAQPDKADPDGFEAAYRAGLTANPDTPGGGLNNLPKSTVDVSGTFSNIGGFLGGSSNRMSIASSSGPACPAGPSFSVKGQEYQLDFSWICEFASIMGYLIVVSASLTGVRIFIGGAYQ